MKHNKCLKVENLGYAFNDTKVLENVSFSVQEGEITAIVGRSGCGKSTLLNLISGLLQPQQGVMDNRFESASVLFQEPRLLPWKTVRENIAWGLKSKGYKKADRNIQATQLAAEIGLSHEDMNKYPHELSGGMKQRVALARSLAVKPDFLMLDEPFSALDVGSKEELHTLLMNETKQHSLTVFFITHDLIEAVKLADRILVFDNNPGRLVHIHDCKSTDKGKTENQYLMAAELLKIPEIQKAFSTE